MIDKIDRMDRDIRKMNDRLIRVETMIEAATTGKGGGRKPMIDQ